MITKVEKTITTIVTDEDVKHLDAAIKMLHSLKKAASENVALVSVDTGGLIELDELGRAMCILDEVMNTYVWVEK